MAYKNTPGAPVIPKQAMNIGRTPGDTTLRGISRFVCSRWQKPDNSFHGNHMCF